MQSRETEVGTAVARALCAAPDERDLDAISARVATAVSEAETSAERGRVRDLFAQAISARRFLPSVPILANAGRSNVKSGRNRATTIRRWQNWPPMRAM